MIKLLIMIFILYSCTGSHQEPTGRVGDWERAPLEYKCKEDQIKLVSQEFDVCRKSSFLSSYCYGSVLIKYCDKIKDNHEFP
jgi:hypothetical protein